MSHRIYFDGGTRLNSVCIYDQDLSFYDVKKFFSRLTNNQLEYHALFHAIKYADVKYPFLENVEFAGDSELIINHMTGKYKVQNVILKGMHQMVSEEILKITGKPHTPDMFVWVARAFNEAGVHLEELA